MTTNFMIGTFILLLSYLVSFPTASIMSKTIYVSTKIKICIYNFKIYICNFIIKYKFI